MKKILVLLVFITSIFAADATIEVVNRGLVLPRILIQDATTNFASSDVKERFSRMIAGDLTVGSAFEVIEGIEKTTYDAPLGAEIAAKNPAFVLRYELAGGSGETMLKVKLIDTKDSSVRFEANYSQSDLKRWPFLSHRAIADIARNL